MGAFSVNLEFGENNRLPRRQSRQYGRSSPKRLGPRTASTRYYGRRLPNLAPRLEKFFAGFWGRWRLTHREIVRRSRQGEPGRGNRDQGQGIGGRPDEARPILPGAGKWSPPGGDGVLPRRVVPMAENPLPTTRVTLLTRLSQNPSDQAS